MFVAFVIVVCDIIIIIITSLEYSFDMYTASFYQCNTAYTVILHLRVNLAFFLLWKNFITKQFLTMLYSGKDAPIDELVDFIIAAQIAENFEKETDNTPHYDGGTLEVLYDVFM